MIIQNFIDQDQEKQVTRMKKKQIIAIVIVCCIVIATGLVGVRSAIMMNDLKEKSTLTAQKNLEQLLGMSGDQIDLPDEEYIGQIDIVGTIQEDDAGAAGMVSGSQYRHSQYLKFIEQMEGDEKNKGIFLYVDSPGGTVYASDEMYLRLMEYKEKTGRPIVPISRYTSRAKPPSRPPSSSKVQHRAKVCRVKGMGPGTVIQAQTAVKTAQRAI